MYMQDLILTPEEEEIIFKYRDKVEKEKNIPIKLRDALMLIILEKGQEL